MKNVANNVDYGSGCNKGTMTKWPVQKKHLKYITWGGGSISILT